jgi:hypothetical protein
LATAKYAAEISLHCDRGPPHQDNQGNKESSLGAPIAVSSTTLADVPPQFNATEANPAFQAGSGPVFVEIVKFLPAEKSGLHPVDIGARASGPQYLSDSRAVHSCLGCVSHLIAIRPGFCRHTEPTKQTKRNHPLKPLVRINQERGAEPVHQSQRLDVTLGRPRSSLSTANGLAARSLEYVEEIKATVLYRREMEMLKDGPHTWVLKERSPLRARNRPGNCRLARFGGATFNDLIEQQ